VPRVHAILDRLNTLDYGLGELRDVVGTLDDSVMDDPTNCGSWSVRQLASHALNNQLVWAGLVTGQQLVAVEDAMGAVAITGDLGPVAVDVTKRAVALWRTDGILDAMHTTPFGELPGSVVIDFAIIDAVAHSWDLATSVGRPLVFDPAQIPVLSEVVAATCNDAAREHGLIEPPTRIPADATDTERLMSAAGRAIRR
jgi:uncharacterized protein (TIGR03086 family)